MCDFLLQRRLLCKVDWFCDGYSQITIMRNEQKRFLAEYEFSDFIFRTYRETFVLGGVMISALSW